MSETPPPGTPALRVERVALDDPRWLALVSSSSGTTPSHVPAWTHLVADTYGFPAFALVLVRDGRAVAGVPLVDVTTRLRGRRYSCLPFTDHCAPLASPELLPYLTHALSDLRADDRLARIEVRDALPSVARDVVSYQTGVRHQISLAPSVDEAFAALSSHHRRAVRTAERTGLRIEVGASPALVDAFARLHAATRKRLGVPVQPRRFLRALGAALERDGLGYVVVAWHNDRAVASGVFLKANGVVMYKFGASEPDAWKLRPNNLLVWEAIRQSVEQRAVLFDFGRSDVGQEGLCNFKRNFGAAESPLMYTSIGAEPSERQLKPGRFSQLVIRRSPSFVGKAVGRALYRYVA